MEVFYFKLYNGEDIIAEMLDEDEEFAYITMPYKIFREKEADTGNRKSYMTQWILIDSAMKSEITLAKQDVILAVKLDEEREKEFIKIVSKKFNIDMHNYSRETKKPNALQFRDNMRLLFANTASMAIH